MKSPVLAVAALATIALAGCRDDQSSASADSAAAVASCTMEELQGKSVELATALQANPSAAASLTEKMTELAPRFQEAVSGGEVSDELLGELCGAYDELLAELN